MVVRHDDEAERLIVEVGHAIVAWSFVERHLALLFNALFLGDRDVGDLLWSRVRSFDAKLQMLNDLASLVLKEENQKRDWVLLRDHIGPHYRKRNSVAHGTPVTSGGQSVLEPFSSLFRPNPNPLGPKAIAAYAASFLEIATAIQHFTIAVRPDAPRLRLIGLDNDLLDRLRKEADRKLEARRHRDQVLHRYRKENPDLKI